MPLVSSSCSAFCPSWRTSPHPSSYGAQGLTAIALESGRARRPRLAAAARSGKRTAAVVVFEVFQGVAALGPAARCVAQAELAEPLSVKVRLRARAHRSRPRWPGQQDLRTFIECRVPALGVGPVGILINYWWVYTGRLQLCSPARPVPGRCA